jgi:hypothetical protein
MAAIVLVERMTRTRCEKPILSSDLCSMMAGVCHEKQTVRLLLLYHGFGAALARKNPHLLHLLNESMGV